MDNISGFAIQIEDNSLVIFVSISNTLDLISLAYKINTTNLFKELKEVIIKTLSKENV